MIQVHFVRLNRQGLWTGQTIFGENSFDPYHKSPLIMQILLKTVKNITFSTDSSETCTKSFGFWSPPISYVVFYEISGRPENNMG